MHCARAGFITVLGQGETPDFQSRLGGNLDKAVWEQRERDARAVARFESAPAARLIAGVGRRFTMAADDDGRAIDGENGAERFARNAFPAAALNGPEKTKGDDPNDPAPRKKEGQ